MAVLPLFDIFKKSVKKSIFQKSAKTPKNPLFDIFKKLVKKSIFQKSAKTPKNGCFGTFLTFSKNWSKLGLRDLCECKLVFRSKMNAIYVQFLEASEPKPWRQNDTIRLKLKKLTITLKKI
jgi:hypothetical protein